MSRLSSYQLCKQVCAVAEVRLSTLADSGYERSVKLAGL